VRLDDLSATVGKDAERWRQVAEQVRDGPMPPRKEPRPEDGQARAVVSWVAAATAGAADAPVLPNKGNLIPHEAPSGAPAGGPEEAATPARVWLLGPDGYAGFVRDGAGGRAGAVGGIVQPFTPVADRGIKDFAALYSIDEPTAQVLVRNAEAIVEAQTAYEIKDGKPRGKDDTVGDFVKLMDPAARPTRAQVEGAVQPQFRMAIGRRASAEELGRLVALYDGCAADGGGRPPNDRLEEVALPDLLARRVRRTTAGGRRPPGGSITRAERSDGTRTDEWRANHITRGGATRPRGPAGGRRSWPRGSRATSRGPWRSRGPSRRATRRTPRPAPC